jgi:hypothetical protein
MTILRIVQTSWSNGGLTDCNLPKTLAHTTTDDLAERYIRAHMARQSHCTDSCDHTSRSDYRVEPVHVITHQSELERA